MKAILYSRVSTKEQVKGISLEAQDDIMFKKATEMGYETEFIRDAGLSAGNLNRIGIQTIIDRIKNRKKGDSFEAVFVYNHKRISRDVHDLEFIRKLAKKKGVKIFSISEGFDLTDEEHEMHSQILGVMAQRERKDIGRVTKFALNHLKETGRVYAKLPYGFDKEVVGEGDNAIKNLVPKKEEIDIVKTVYSMKGKGTRTIANHLNEAYQPREGKKFYPSSVTRILNNEQFYRQQQVI